MRSRRWLLLLIALPLACGLARLRFDADVLHLLPRDIPAITGLRLYHRYFANADELIVTVRGQDAESTEAATGLVASALRRRAEQVSEVVWQPPWLEHPEQAGELLAALWLSQPPEELRKLADSLSTANIAATLQAARQDLATSVSASALGTLGYDPLGFTRLPQADVPGPSSMMAAQDGFASPDGRLRIIFVRSRHDISNYRKAATWLCHIKETVAHSEKEPGFPSGIVIGYTGAPAFLAEIATGMERDIQSSVAGTLAVVAILFWVTHRRWRGLFCVLASLALIVAGTLAVGGIVFGTLNVISMGFAAILIGLAVDYGLVLYEEGLHLPGLSSRALRDRVAPSIWWSAATTATAFALLNFAGLPGLTQLGTLVAVGVLLGAIVMLYAFLPAALAGREQPDRASDRVPPGTSTIPSVKHNLLTWSLTLLMAATVVVVLSRGLPEIDSSPDPLQPKQSPAAVALADAQAALGQSADASWLLIAGRDEAEVSRALESAERVLSDAARSNWISDYKLPTDLWPRPQWQQVNRPVIARIVSEQDALRQAAIAAGFTTNALALSDAVVSTWRRALENPGTYWPENEANRWLFRRFSAKTQDGWIAQGVVNPGRNAQASEAKRRLETVAPQLVWTSWASVGKALAERVEGRVIWLTVAMAAILVLCLWLAFRQVTEVVLSLASLGFSLVLLLTIMAGVGWSWNLMNLVAVPLLLGAGVDYSIHIQFALRRYHGDAPAVRRVTGKALFLCAATTMAGFGSLAWASNTGLASFGLVCATGVGCAWLTSTYLLPAWWLACRGAPADHPRVHPLPATPSSLYRLELWRLGLKLAATLPAPVIRGLARFAGVLYWRLRPRRARIVAQNLLPVCDNSAHQARRAARSLVSQFAVKMADLWRFEAGADVPGGFVEMNGWDQFAQAHKQGRGVLMITIHLGNWELGGPLLAERGVKLVISTQAEPARGLTELRRASRAMRGVETLVVGQDAFAFVGIIKRLQDGATVAMMLDRPDPSKAVTIELFGQPFLASSAAAELARASGCALIGVYLPRKADGYAAYVLPEFVYDRRDLGDREARRLFTQQIMRAFEPAIRQYCDQWYHFVPIWPKPAGDQTEKYASQV